MAGAIWMTQRRTYDERGSISIWVITATLAMMILVGLAVDLGGQVHAQQRAHDVAAQAARTGGQQVQAVPAVEGRYVALDTAAARQAAERSEEPTSELQSQMRISYAAFCLKKKNTNIILNYNSTE